MREEDALVVIVKKWRTSSLDNLKIILSASLEG